MAFFNAIELTPSSPAGAEAPKYDDTMNVKMLLKEICPFLDMPSGCEGASSSSAAALSQPTSQQVLQVTC